jgi:hypothetical protein
MATQTEVNIQRLVTDLEVGGRNAPRKIDDLPDFPRKTFEELTQAVTANELHIQRLSFELDVDLFGLLATSSERLWMRGYRISLLVVPIFVLALGYSVSWWFLLGSALIPLAIKRIKDLYAQVILHSAFHSESIFCFLYYIGQVSICPTDSSEVFSWNPDKHGL